jgi:hypothetical protein
MKLKSSVMKTKHFPLRFLLPAMFVGPDYFFIMRGENAASYYARSMESWEMMGEDAARIRKEMISLLRKVDPKHLWYRKDLGYIPAAF